ncbi:uncharacterized protein LOC144153885 [Haemaphysalis longicornis]
MGAGRSVQSDGSPEHSPFLQHSSRLQPRPSEDNSTPQLLSPSPVRPPISSPPPRPAGDLVAPSPPPASKASHVPIVKTTRVSATGSDRRHSIRADSPMPKLPGAMRRLSDPSEDQPPVQPHHHSDLESQIREIEQMTDGILEDIEAENLGGFSTGHDPTVKTTTSEGAKWQLDAGKTGLPLRGSFERGLFTNAARFAGLGRTQLPPTRSMGHGSRRASHPRDAAAAGFRSGSHRQKAYSRSTGSDVRSQSQPVASVPSGGRYGGAQSRTPLANRRPDASRGPFQGLTPKQETTASKAPAARSDADTYDFSKYHQANQREQASNFNVSCHWYIPAVP